MHVEAWRRFKRMQVSACLFAALIFMAAAIHGWRVLPGTDALKRAVILGFPGVYFVIALGLPLQIGPLRRRLKRYVWVSFVAGFGQSVISVLTGLGLLAAAAAFIFLQITSATHGGRYPVGAFSAYGAVVGVLFAQMLLVFALEREPETRRIIEG